MPRRLTVQDKILIHLSGYARYAEEFECPEDISQSGIAEAIGKTRAHTTLELKRLKEVGRIAERLSYVKGAKVKKKVYQLSSSGWELATNLKKSVSEEVVVMRGADGQDEMSGESAIEALKMAGVKEVAAYEMIAGTEGIVQIPDTSDLAPPGPSSGFGEGGMPVDEGSFFGRVGELAEMKELLAKHTAVAVIGMPGIGKSAFARRLAREYEGHYTTAYVKLYDFDTPVSVARSLAASLKELGGISLINYIDSDNRPEVRHILWHLGEIVSKSRILIILDDYDMAGKEVDSFTKAIHNTLARGNSKLMTLSESRPSYYTVKEVELEKSVGEFELGGLDDGAALELLASVGKIPGELRDRCVRGAGGNPLALKLATPENASSELGIMVYEDFFSEHSEAMEFMAVASVLRRGFDPVSMSMYGFSHAPGLARSAAFKNLESGGVALQSPVKAALTGKLGGKGIEKAHAIAADYCMEFEEEPIEVLYHLASARQTDRASKYAVDMEDYLLSGSRIAETRKVLDLMNPAEPDIMDMRAEAANIATHWDEAVEISRKLFEATDRPELIFKAGLRLAKISAKKGENENALELLDDISLAGIDRALLTSYYLFLGVVHRNLGNYDDSAMALEKAAKLAVDKYDKIRCRMEMGSLATVSGDLEGGLNDLAGARTMAEEQGSIIDLASIHLNLGLLSTMKGDFGAAIENYQKAADIGKSAGLPRVLAYALVGFSDAMTKMNNGNEEVAIEKAGEAIDILEDLGIRDMVAAAYSNMATARARSGDMPSANLNFKMAIDICKTTDSPRTLGQIYFEYGIALAGAGEIDDSARMLAEAEQIFKIIENESDLRMVKKAVAHLRG